MKYILLVISFFISFAAFSQIPVPPYPIEYVLDDTAHYVHHPYTYGLKENRIYATKVLRAPKDTIYTKSGIAIMPNSKMYYGDEERWRELVTSTAAGTVTSVSVVTANGLAGTVANPTTTPAITLTTTVTTNQMLYASSSAIVGSASLTFDGNLQTLLAAGLGVTQTDTKGILLTNTTAATSGNQQISPSIHWSGRGWKTDATAASQSVDFRAYVLPVQGTANPSATWKLQSSVNGGSYTDVFQIGSFGEIITSTGSKGTTGQAIVSRGAGFPFEYLSIDTSLTNEMQTTTGTSNRITVTSGSTNPVIDIASTYVGQTSITTLGTITTGTWNATDIAFAYIAQLPTVSLAGNSTGGTADIQAITLGTGLSFVGTVLTPADNSATNEIQALTAGGSTSPTINLSMAGGTVTLSPSGLISFSRSSNTITIDATEAHLGDVTEFFFSDGNGFDGTVSTSTSTPTLSLTTTITNQRVLVSNSGALSGSAEFTFASGMVSLGGTTNTGKINLATAASGTLTLQPAASFTSYTFTFPNSPGTNGWGLVTNGSGGTSWQALPTYTADNGLTMSSNNTKLGGVLTQFTTIGAGTLYALEITGNQSTGVNNALFNVSNLHASGRGIYVDASSSTSGNGILVYGTSAVSIIGQTTSGYGFQGIATSGTAGRFEATTGIGIDISVVGSGLPLFIVDNSAETDDVVLLADLRVMSTGTVDAGFGGKIDIILETVGSGTSGISNQLLSYWTEAVDGAQTSRFVITGTELGTTSDLFTIEGSGQVRLNKYGTGAFTGEPAYGLAVDATGNIIETSAPLTLAAGRYTPTRTSSSNVASWTIYDATYQRVGNSVTVSGKIEISHTNCGLNASIDLSLPVSTSMTDDNMLAGTATEIDVVTAHGTCSGDAAGDELRITVKYSGACSGIATATYYYTYTYFIE